MRPIPTLEEIEELVLEMKDTSELMVDMALSSLLYQSEDLAEEVRLLEDHVDDVYSRVQLMALEGAREDVVNIDQALALARLSEGTERIADAAREIADVVLREVEPHPVLAASMAESDVVFVRCRVREAAALAGQALGEARVQSETGMHVFAIRRQGSWRLGPEATDVVEEGDVLMASGPEEGREKLQDLCGVDPEDDG
ncbi:MAG: PhoU domain-containing protein [Candidatus Thermoplasmatota archaeon]|nr:PhoU domain-containing protein [Candidatus Thermoplasmatota archaeon]